MDKHLIIFSYDYPPSDGGIARLCQEIADGMNKYYNSVVVLTRKKEGISTTYNFNNVKIINLPSKRILCELAAWWFLIRINQKKTTDILCGLWYPEGLLCLLAGIENVYILGHGTEFLSGPSSFRKNFWLPFLAKNVLKKSKFTIANSKYTAGLINKIYPQTRVTAIPLAVNHNFFRPFGNRKNNGKLNLVTVSRILKFKGYDFIAETISKLPQNYKNKIEWNIGGTGAYLNELKTLVSNLNLNEIVTFHGFVPDDILPEFYSENDIFVMCTREKENDTSVEGFGLVFLEAQSCGTPVIGTKSGGIPDAINHQNGGWLIEQDNFEDLSQILISLIDNSLIINDQSIKARNRVMSSCTWEMYCEKLNKILQG